MTAGSRFDLRLGQMRSDVAGSPWPPASDDRHAVLAAMALQLDASQWLTPGEIERRQYQQLVTLATFHVQHSRAFAERLRAADMAPADLASPAGLARLGELSRAMMQDKGQAADPAALPAKHGPTAEVNTSGSTGEPVRVVRTALNRLHWMALSVRFHLWGEPGEFGRFAAIRANLATHGVQPHWAAPMAALWDTGPLLLINIEDDVDAQLDQLVEFAPDSVMVYPSNLAALLDRMVARGIDLPSVKRWRTLGETLTLDLIERIKLTSKVPIHDAYSTEEVGYVAVQCPDDPAHYHICSETLIVELVDAGGKPVRRGEAGRVLITDLHNFATPLIRYAIGDMAIAGGPCRCGRGLPTLKRIIGRVRNMITKPDGSRHWPLTGYKQFRDIAPIRQYQFRQHAIDHIEVRLVTERPLSQSEEDALRAHLHWKLRHPFRIDFVYFEGRLPLGRNGKFEEFVCLL